MITLTNKEIQVKENGQWVNVDVLGSGGTGAKAKGNVLVPIYIGDYMAYDRGIQGMCVVGDKVYTVNVYDHNKMAELETDTGVLRVFDITNNCELPLLSKEIPAGHANSMCYDYENENFYIAQEFTYTSGVREDALWILKFDKNFDYIGKVTTPTQAQAVSYDPITGTLYYYGWSGTCYKWNGTSFVKFCDFDNGNIKPGLTRTSFNQDFAVYNDRYFVSAENNNMVSGKLTSGVSRPDSSFVYHQMDSTTRFRLGETQGMEFTPDGHLFAGNGTGLFNNIVDCFIVELPVGMQAPYATNLRGNTMSYRQGTISLSEASVTSFALSTDQVRSLSQLEIMSPQGMATEIVIQENSNITEDAVIRISRNCQITVNGRYTCQKLELFGANVQINASDARTDSDFHICLTTTQPPIEMRRASILTIAGPTNLRFSIPNRGSGDDFVYAPNTLPFIMTDYRPSCSQGYTLRLKGVSAAFNQFQTGTLTHPVQVRSLTKHYTPNQYVAENDFNYIAYFTRPYTPNMLTIDFTLSEALPQNTDVEIGRIEAQTANRVACVYNVASTMGGANVQVTVSGYGVITIRTSGNTLSGDSYKTGVAIVWADDNW